MQRAKWLVLLVGIALRAQPQGPTADLDTKTKTAWQEQVGSFRAQTQARLSPNGCFLWAQEEPSRIQRLRSGEILASPAGHTPFSVPGGLIHHWIGAVFLPGATLAEVLSTVRDYAHYPDYYPSVVRAKLDSGHAMTDTFSTLEQHHALFSTIAFDADFSATYAAAGPGRAYSLSSTTRLQQVDDYGKRSQRELAQYASKAYLWSLTTTSRYWEHDGGVYLEVEGLALSRDVPEALRWLVDPFVRRAAEGAMIASLRETRNAVHSNHSLQVGNPGEAGKPPAALALQAP